ncbi:MAG: carboxylesterase family protein, partial [Dehalococcoidales bacterium]|nr:carboxylesterase family protein [Dehalococcoidales bacterium]
MRVVKTDKGYVSGTIIGEPGKEVSIYRGIPFAAPPVGNLRWKPPQPAEPWSGIRECTKFRLISPQPVMGNITGEMPQGEDCLYLNVLTPAREPDEKLPVLVWMHGGGYSMGSGNDKIWNFHRLPQRCVLVTLNHRLGPFGLLAHPALSAESKDGVSGNYLFLDLIASLKWIQKNIAAFGGDPDNVTIFGESGGGAKVSIMMVSPLAKGLFHRAICESGTATAILKGMDLAEAEAIGEKLFKKLGISGKNALEEVRQIPFEKIMHAAIEMEPPRKPGVPPAPLWDAAVDGKVIPVSPTESFLSGAINAVPLIVSANLGELLGPGMLVMPFIIPAYIDMLKAVIKNGCAGYACIFDQVPAGWKKEGCNSVHSIELPYVFGDWDNSTGWWKSVFMIAQASGAKSMNPGLTEHDRTVSEAMINLWT